MDKYTVDLDKVLNDFEYSELTEQVVAAPAPSEQPTTYSPDSRGKNGNVKHSINNVFSSLNEYLNSEIKRDNISTAVEPNNEQPSYRIHGQAEEVGKIDSSSNKTDDSFKLAADFSVNISDIVLENNDNKSSEVNQGLSTEVVYKQSNCEGISAIEDNFKVLNLNTESNESNTISACENIHVRIIDVQSSNLKSSESIWDTKSIEINNEKGDKCIKSDILENNTSVSSQNDSQQNDTSCECILNNQSDSEELSKVCNEPGLGVYVDDISSDNTNTLREEHAVISSKTEENNSFSTKSTKLRMEKDVLYIEETHSSISEKNQTDIDLIDESDRNEIIDTKTEEDVCNATEIETKPQIIGFDSNIDLNDDELNDILENLDQELEAESNRIAKDEELEAEVKREAFNNEAVEAENNQISQVDNHISDNTSDIGICGFPQQQHLVSYSFPSASAIADFENCNSISDAIPNVRMGDAENKNVDVDNVENVDLDKNVLNADEKYEDVSGAIANVEASAVTSTERPNSLDISNGGSGDSKREINLIGNPGSTPYNNLYISKEMSSSHLKVNNQYESESSASMSPTFSEASTDSVHSSDSTDSDTGIAAARKPTDKLPTIPNEQVSGNDISGTGEPAEPTAKVLQADENVEDIYVDLDSINRNVTSQSAAETEQVSEVVSESWLLGKRAPVWIPDSDALNCLHCDMKFTVIKRRHHCRACGLVLCSKCCSKKYRLDYLDVEARVCTKCYDVLSAAGTETSVSAVPSAPPTTDSPIRQTPAAVSTSQPNPNNPMEYCSVVPPLQQVSSVPETPPTVMVPVGVLKRKGSNKAKHNKSVMFCDGIRPGSDLTNLDNDFNYNETKTSSSSSSSSSSSTSSSSSSKKHQQQQPQVQQQPQQTSTTTTTTTPVLKSNKNVPALDTTTKSFIPENENCLPPTVTKFKCDISYTECANNPNVVEMLKNETLTFALHRNIHVNVRLVSMDCCINKQAWCFATEGLIAVGQDEIVILLEYVDGEIVPKDIFHHLNNIYSDALKGTTVTELGLSMHPTTNFLASKNHAGFIFIRPTYQCLQHLLIPKESYLVGILVHRWETPWAKNFPLRLVLRLGAEYRYYPSPLISTRNRNSVFVEIGHTIINLLADFRNFTFTLPNIRGLTIHMEDKNTTVTIPVNRYDQVMKSLNNSSDHILAFGGNFSEEADSHLVCIQDTEGSNESSYTTHAINIQNRPRKVTGASFIVFNGALKSSSGLTAKCSIVEDGLMIQIPAEHMLVVRESLRNMENHTINCGCINAVSDETVSIVWGQPDVNFNTGITSSIDDQSLSGIPSIRVHNGKDHVCNSGNRLIRWTEVFLLQNGEENARTQDPVDVSKVAENISKATCQALVKYLDLLATNNFYKIGIRTTLHVENVSYCAGSNGIKLPPIYMKSLDNELVPVLHRITSNNIGDSAIVLELVFRILNV